MENQAEIIKDLLDAVKKTDQDRLEKTSVEIRREEHSALAEPLIGMTSALFKRCSLESCFTGETVDGKRLVALYIMLREELVREKIKCIKFESAKDILAKACLSGDMDTINAALTVLGCRPPPRGTTTH